MKVVSPWMFKSQHGRYYKLVAISPREIARIVLSPTHNDGWYISDAASLDFLIFFRETCFPNDYSAFLYKDVEDLKSKVDYALDKFCKLQPFL